MAYLLDFHLLAQVIVYFASVIAGMVVVLPMIDLPFNEAFRNICSVTLGVCSSTVIVSFLFGILHVKAMTMRDPNTGANMRTGLYTSVNVVVTSFVFACAILIQRCENIADNPGFSCRDFSDNERLLIAQIACWVFSAVLLIQLLLGFARMYRKPPTSPEVGDRLSVFAVSTYSPP